MDLDGTLLKGDLLHEGLATALKSSPWTVVHAIFSLHTGRAALKQRLAAATTIDVANLPFRSEVIDLIHAARTSGSRIVLATAADEIWARQIASQLGLFDEVLASNGARNLKGAAKLDAIRGYCQEHGFAAFDYVGDSHADLPIWASAENAYAVTPSLLLSATLRRHGPRFTAIGRAAPWHVALMRTLRVPQWAKNLLIFVPAITSHRLLELPVSVAVLVAFACFCLCSSGVYALNDILDLQSDRRHPKKRLRPFAAGDLSIGAGLCLALLCLSAGLVLAVSMLPVAFVVLLATYVVVTTLYSVVIKRIVMLDVITLACLYAVRVLGGGLATGIPVSEWLMAFSLFIFLSLAFAKRYAELARLSAAGGKEADGRGYEVGDLSLIEGMGPPCGFLAVLVLALYIQSDQMRQLYSGSWALWLLCPLLAYWVGRIWVLAKRGLLGEDPVVFAIRDPVSILLAILAGVLIVAGAAAN